MQPLDLLCLSILERFWFACRNGRCGAMVDDVPWVRVTAADMVELLGREGLEVSEKTAQRALKRLGEFGLVQKEKRYLKRWDHRTWYAPPGRHETDDGQTPSDQAEERTGVSQKDADGEPGRTPGDLPINNSWIKSSNKQSKASSDGTEGEPMEIDCRRMEDRQPTVEVVMTIPTPTRDFQEILRRCQERGGAELSQPTVEARKKVVVDGEVRVVNDGVTSPLR